MFRLLEKSGVVTEGWMRRWKRCPSHKKTQRDTYWGCWTIHTKLLSLGAAPSVPRRESPWSPCFHFTTVLSWTSWQDQSGHMTQLPQSGFPLLLAIGNWDWEMASPPGILFHRGYLAWRYVWPPSMHNVWENTEDTQKEAERRHKCCPHAWQPSGSPSWWLGATCLALGSRGTFSSATNRSLPITISSEASCSLLLTTKRSLK